jgi:hypothetical protein
LKIKEPGYLFPITGGIITILGLILPLGYYNRFDGTGNMNIGSFFWILFHNIETNDLNFNFSIYLMISYISISIVGCTAWTFKIINNAKKKKINKKKFETEMFQLAIILFLLGIELILIVGNGYLIETYDHHTGWFLPSSMWGYYSPSFGFYGLIFGPIIIRFGTFYNTVDTVKEEIKVIVKTFIVLILLLFLIWLFSFSFPGLDFFLAFLTIPIIMDSAIYLFSEKEHHLAEVSQPDIIIKENNNKKIKHLVLATPIVLIISIIFPIFVYVMIFFIFIYPIVSRLSKYLKILWRYLKNVR